MSLYRSVKWSVIALVAMHAAISSAQTRSEDAPTDTVLEEVTVSSTPLGGAELPLDRVPGNVQRSTRADLEKVRRAGLVQFLDQERGSFFLNEAQANPLQPDAQLRGFLASPLLGSPQGIAVYQNGVRINEAFGDVVNWALVPEGAIASVDVIPGSNPVFGLNALGGAISLRTKTGFTDQGTAAEVMHGSFDRTIAKIESGGEFLEGFSYYGHVRYFDEAGWRDHSPSHAVHLFGDVGWRDANSSVDLALTRVTTDLIGNGPAPLGLLEAERDAIYTHPDRTQNALTFVALSGSHRLNEQVEMQAVTFSRASDIDTVNGDESPYEPCEIAAASLCDEDDAEVVDTRGNGIAFGPDVADAALNRGRTRQRTQGLSAQASVVSTIWSRENRFIIGASFDRSRIRFESEAELARFDSTRGAIGSGFVAEQSLVRLHSHMRNASVFVTDTFAVTPMLDFIAAARFNDTSVELRDQIGTALNGDHEFRRLNPSAGLSYRPSQALTMYASYSESNRAPSPVELTCADENDPCALPNAFLSDPPLEQVIARTIEVGTRGTLGSTRWHAGVFQTRSDDDILFVSAGALTNHGFFDNVSETRRQGLEVNLHGAIANLAWFTNYTYLQAEFREPFTVTSANNPQARNGELDVQRGAKIPGVPEHIFKAGVSITVTPSLRLDLDIAHQSDQYLRGDEANLTEPLAGFTVVNFAAQWQASERLQLFAQIDNLLDREYATFGMYGAAGAVLGDTFDDPTFVSPAAPRAIWVGVSWRAK